MARWLGGFLLLDTLVFGWSTLGVGMTLMMLAMFGYMVIGMED